MTLYEQYLADLRGLHAAHNRIYQPLDYAVPRVVIDRPRRIAGRCAVRVQKPTVPVTVDAVLTAVEAVRQTKDRGS